MSKSIAYLDNIFNILKNIKETQSDNIEKATRLMFDSFQQGGSVFVFGASHAGILTEEMFCRAGGLMVVNPIFNPTLMLSTRPFTITSAMERLEGFGNVILSNSAVKKGDVLIMHSVSGRNSVAIDMAMQAREMGVHLIVITNMTYTTQSTSRHSSGKLLYEFGDVVIDNCGAYGDASTEVCDGVIAGPTSTVSGATIINMMAVGFAQLCDENGIDPPVFVSANADVDASRSETLMQKYSDRIHYL